MSAFTHETYLSPYTWRYGSAPMRRIWSDEHKRRLWRRCWVALAEAQQAAGLTTDEQVQDLREHQHRIDIQRAHELEHELRHDLMAEVHAYAEQCKIGGGVIHLGATSMDIEDNADALRLKEALAHIKDALDTLLIKLAHQIKQHAETVCMAYTHLQPAEPTTIGYRLAFYAQDLLQDRHEITTLQQNLCGKGLKGAVGTMASYAELLADTEVTPEQLEQSFMASLGLDAFDITHQTYTRRQDWQIVSTLAGLAMTIHKFAFDLRILQAPPFGEWHEPFGKQQIGSSAMPFKRNPINAENMDSLARLLATLPRVMWDNGANSLLERTLDDSGNRRTVIPEAFLIVDELLIRMTKLIDGFTVHIPTVERNLQTYGVFAATERVLMQAVKNGGNRQELHEIIRQHSMTAWNAVRNGQPNPLIELLTNDAHIHALLPPDTIRLLLDASAYTGEATTRAAQMASNVMEQINRTD